MKATLNSNRATIADYNRAFVEYALTIDFSELFDHVKAFAKVECEFEQLDIVTSRSDGSTYIEFQSNDIADQCGPFAAILECCRIMNFGGNVVYDEKTGEFRYWTTVSLRYRHKDGGSNGMTVCQAEYKSGRWTFRNIGEGG